ncbi:hypothetical protein KIN20_026917 [Parelaphostrongylus tenuis]|uniref:Major facilitator superfamily (MFS) profile domain-containing protein n=1 Tax=Parelaphostrongylus tenuis TaxID=148309 RepID=A0AAD5WDA4_PARTN|nr:hypothetical protein KIN20_026917 [Parelaphostrongylus tenuis]
MSEGAKEEGSKNQQDPARVEKDLEEVGFIKPPDGGYGWIVVFASFIANLIVDGIIFTSGDALLSLWQQDFGTSDTASALTLSILSGTYLLVGPIASALANLYGCRAVVIAGSLLAFFGFICSTIAPQIAFLYFSFGLVGGIGFGLIYLPAIVVIAQYFAENRSLATGLAVCGSGIGTTIFSTRKEYSHLNNNIDRPASLCFCHVSDTALALPNSRKQQSFVRKAVHTAYNAGSWNQRRD